MANVYSQPTYAQSSQGTANTPKLGASSDNISGYDKTTAAILDAVKKDAATNGLTAWGLSFLKQLGETIKPEWLKENSKEWFNKPLPDPLVPPKDEFLKLVEPAVRSLTKPSTYAGEQGVMVGGGWTEAIRDKGGFGGLWEKYHKEAGDLDAQYAKLPDYLDPNRIASQKASIESTEAARIQEKYAPVKSKYGIDPATTPIWQLEAMLQGNRFDNMPAGYNPTNVPSGWQDPRGTSPATVAPTTIAPPAQSAAQKTFLPPYLQPGAPTDANNITGAKLPVATQIASPTPIAPPVTPFTPLMPQGFATPRPVTPGLFPGMAGVPRTGGFGGGFGATAKLLELPYYLRNFGGINYGR